MYMFEFTKRQNMLKLDDEEAKRAIAQKIISDVKRIAKEYNISEEKAYYYYSKGLFGGDNKVIVNGCD